MATVQNSKTIYDNWKDSIWSHAKVLYDAYTQSMQAKTKKNQGIEEVDYRYCT